MMGMFLLVDSVVQGPSVLPHLVPLLMLMEGEDPVENSERGCQLLYDVLQSARNAALHAQDYQEHAHALLSGMHVHPHHTNLKYYFNISIAKLIEHRNAASRFSAF